MSKSAKKRLAAPNATPAPAITPVQSTAGVVKRQKRDPGSKQSRVIAMLQAPAGLELRLAKRISRPIVRLDRRIYDYLSTHLSDR